MKGFSCIVLLGLSCVSTLYAQSSVPRFEHLREVNPFVFDVHQDQEGFIWIAGEGLHRYDGHGFRSYTHVPEDSTSLSGSNVKIIFEDSEGTLWLGTDASPGAPGLNRYNRETDNFTRFVRHPDRSSASPVRAIHEDQAGTLWVGSDEGLYRFDRGREKFARPSDQATIPNGSGVRVIYEDQARTLWIGTTDGLTRIDREGRRSKDFVHDPDDATSLGGGGVSTILEDTEGRFWIGTSAGGICRMNRGEGTFTCLQHDPGAPTSLSDDAVTAIVEDASRMLWVGTSVSTGTGGLNRFDPASGTFDRFLHHPTQPGSLNNNNVQSILLDRSGVLWIGTFGGGLDKLRHTTPFFTPYLPPANDLAAWAVMEDRSGRLWVTSDVGIHRFDRISGTWTSFVHDPNDPSSLGPGIYRALYEDRAEVLWVGTGGGLDRFDAQTGTFEHFRHDPGDSSSLSMNTIRSIHEDRQGRFWIGTWSGGLNLMDRKTGRFTHFVHDPGDPESIGRGVVNNILEDRKGRFWIATSAGGLNIMDREEGSFSRFMNDPNDPTTLSSNDLNPLLQDAHGAIWVGAFDGGLNRLDPGSGAVQRFNARNSCLAHDRILGILQDDDGFLWLNSGKGVIKFDSEQASCTVYGIDDGLVSLNGSPGSFRSERGEFFFGSFGGVHGFVPDAIPVNAEPPQVVLTDFRLFNRTVTPGPESPLVRRITDTDEITLAHSQNSIGFEFAALHFTRPEQNRYTFILDGFDNDWSESGTQRRAAYTNLPPGEYTFRVRAANSDGVWNRDGSSVRVTILNPWWRTAWAYLVYGLLALAGVFGVLRMQQGRILRKERERARERELEHAREIEAVNNQLREHEAQLESQNLMLEGQKDALEKQKQHLVELDAQKSRFFANISHEIRTPLTLILGPLRDALEGHVESERLGTNVPMMYRNARRLLRLINQLLDFSKLEAGAMSLNERRMDLVAFLRDIVLSFSQRAERNGVSLSFSADAESFPLVFDPEKLEKVIANLLSNAVKFTDSGGKIHVSVAEQNGRVDIAVQDTGRGIPAEELSNVFDRFYQVDGSAVRDHEGTGIGLALAQELVALHDGSIAVESTVGFGTTFTIRLPIRPLPDGDASDEASDPGSTHMDETLFEGHFDDGAGAVGEREDPGGATNGAFAPPEAPVILIVEDNSDMRAYLKSRLQRRYGVVEARDGEEGLELAKTLRPDLILADVMMPKKDGYTLCRELKSDPVLGHIPVVLLTAKDHHEGRLEGLETRADDYVAKPFRTDELLARMENLIDLRRRLKQRFSGQVRLGPSDITVPSEDAAFLEQVREVIEAKMGESDFGVDDLANEVGLSARQLQRRLRSAADLSAAAYIRMMRLERAAQLFEQQAGLVSEVAFRVGFKNADHFSRLFHQVFGVPPSEYASHSRRNPAGPD